MDLKTIILTIIINLFTNELSTVKMNCFEKWHFKKFQKKVSNIIQIIVNRNDGSVLTTGEFERFLTFYYPIEKMLLNIVGQEKDQTKKEFISEQVYLFFQKCSTKKMNPVDRTCINELLDNIYNEMDYYYRDNLSKNEKYLRGTIVNARSIISKQIKGESDRIIETLKNDISDVKRILSRKDSIDDEDTIWSIYVSLSKAIMDGRALEVYSLFPLLNVKSKDLELGIAYLLNIFSNISVNDVNFDTVQKEIRSDRLYVDIAQKTMYIALLRKDNGLLEAINERHPVIYDIKCQLLAEEYDVFFIKESDIKDGITFVKYSLSNIYSEYFWLVKRICMFSILNQSIRNAALCVESILGEIDCVIDRVLLIERQVFELGNSSDLNKGKVTKIIDECDILKNSISCIPEDIQKRFYCAYIRIALNFSVDKVHNISGMLPSKFKNDNKIAMLILQADIESGTVEVQHILDLCLKLDEYWLLNNYFVKIINEDPKEVKRLIDLHLFIIERDPSIFLLYVQLVNNLEASNKASELLDKYEEVYGEYIEFWTIRFRIDYSEERLSSVTEQWLNAKIKYLSPEGNIKFLELLMIHKRYKDVLKGVALTKIFDDLPNSFYKIEALALLFTNQEIEALSVFMYLFENGDHNDEVVYYIMALGINNKRNISPDVVKISKESENANLLELAARYEEIYGNYEEAQTLILKALFRSNNDFSQVYGQYIGFHTRKERSMERKTVGVESDTTIHCTDDEGNVRIICIHSKKVLPSEPFFWENAEHIYTETAIQRGLLRKKTNESITLEEGSFTINLIEPIEVFLFRVSTEHMVKNGNAKLIHTSSDVSGKMNVELLKKQIEDYVGSNSSELLWLEQYKDKNELPASIYNYSNYVRITYTELIATFIQDKSILYREAFGSINTADKFILSVAALVILKKVGFNPCRGNKPIVIPTTLNRIVSDDKNIVISDNNREHVASMGIHNGQLYFIEKSDDTKQEAMIEAMELEKYSEKYEHKENVIDLMIEDKVQSAVKELMSIADYDALCLAQKENYAFVAAEIPYSVIARISDINVNTICIADFLSEMCTDIYDLFDYIKQLIEFRFIIPFTDGIVLRLSKTYYNSDNLQQQKLLDRWKQVLDIPIEDSEYSQSMISLCIEILNQTKEDINEDNIIRLTLLYAIVKYKGYSFQGGIKDE